MKKLKISNGFANIKSNILFLLSGMFLPVISFDLSMISFAVSAVLILGIIIFSSVKYKIFRLSYLKEMALVEKLSALILTVFMLSFLSSDFYDTWIMSSKIEGFAERLGLSAAAFVIIGAVVLSAGLFWFVFSVIAKVLRGILNLGNNFKNTVFCKIIVCGFFFVTAANIAALIINTPWLNRFCLFADGIELTMILYCCLGFAARKSGVRLKKSDFIVLLSVCAVLFGIYFSIVYIRNIIYIHDSTTYFIRIGELLKCFDESSFLGTMQLLRSGMLVDYGDFLLVFIYPFFCILGFGGIKAFVISLFFGSVIPSVSAMYILGRAVIKKSNDSILLKALIAILVISLPILHFSSIMGQPDIAGMVYIGLIMLLTLKYDFSRIDKSRYFVILTATIALVLTRRWYVFFLIGYYAVYFLYILISSLVKKDNFAIRLGNILRFGTVSVFACLALMKDFLVLVFASDYAGSYAAWKKGGFVYEMENQVGYLGVIVAAVILFGFVCGLIKRNTRAYTFICVAAYIFSAFVFNRIQSIDTHHSLIFTAYYLYGLLLAVSALYEMRFKILSILPTAVVCASMVNCCCFDVSGNTADLLLSNLYLYPYQRTDLKEIAQMVNYMNGIIGEDETVTVLCASKYDAVDFRGYPEPETNKYFSINNYNASSGGFPESFFNDKYVIDIDPLMQHSIVEKAGVLEKLKNTFENNSYIFDKFEAVYTMEFPENVTATVYRRETAVDNKEIDIFIDTFSEYSDNPIFYDRLMSYKK